MLQERLEVTPITVQCTVNGAPVEATTMPNRTLLDFLRDTLRLTGAKEGCGTGDCGACTVIVDGRTINSCIMLAGQANGKTITTVEGLAAPDGTLSPVQQAFVETGGLQCGFCTPGFVVTATAFLEQNPNPTENEVRVAIAGNLCRCTGYSKIVDAVLLAARKKREATV
ncbi:MAG: (2Fe-2S)-binding protein [Dehalococcoidia bacterium]|nr:(2Fe-2S)-binding protein [Dehalococcoidia bacterium]